MPAQTTRAEAIREEKRRHALCRAHVHTSRVTPREAGGRNMKHVRQVTDSATGENEGGGRRGGGADLDVATEAIVHGGDNDVIAGWYLVFDGARAVDIELRRRRAQYVRR